MGAYRQTMLDGLCRQLAPRHIALIGARDPVLAHAMLNAAVRAGAVLHVIAERPGEALAALRKEGGDACILHDAPASAALSVLPVPALCWIDADPNWYTAYGALEALWAQAGRVGGAYPIVIVEGTGWPHGRRDGYDDPAAIPPDARHPHERAGLLPGQAMPAGGGGLCADGYHATAENEPRNGVLTAVEDFIEGRSADLRMVRLPGFGGRVAIAPRSGRGADAFSPVALADYLHAAAEALEAMRLDQAVALATAASARARAETLIGLLRHAAARERVQIAPEAIAPAPPWRARLRPAARLVRRLVPARPAAPDEAPGQQEAQQVARLLASPIFDAAWYVAQYPDVAAAALDPALHYLRDGAAEWRDPGPFFSTGEYLAAHPDVAEAGINPVLHYLASGAAEGRAPGLGFDPRAYAEQHPELAATGETPLEHFIKARRVGGRQPGG